MPTKKDLAALLGETPQPPLRRGRGLRLSRASKQARELAPKPSMPPEQSSPQSSAPPESPVTVAVPPTEPAAAEATVAEVPSAPDAVAVRPDALAAAPVESVAALDPAPTKPEREKRKIQLRKDLLKQCKRLARAQDRKLYQVIEAALEEYLWHHGAPE